MLVAEARVATERSSRYLVQLCRHVRLAARAHPQMRAQVEWSDDRGVIEIDRGRCTLRADPAVLVLRVEAPDPQTLHELERRVADRLAQVSRRDRLTLTWTQKDDGGEETRMTDPRSPETGDDSGAGYEPERTGIPRWIKVAGIVVAVVVLLVVVLMLTGVLGGGDGGGHGPRRH
jgi:hypothetical protein